MLGSLKPQPDSTSPEERALSSLCLENSISPQHWKEIVCVCVHSIPPNTGRKSCVCVCVCVHSISPQHWKEIMCVCVCLEHSISPQHWKEIVCVCVCVCVCVHLISPQHWKEIVCVCTHTKSLVCVCVCVCVHARQVPSVVSNSWQPHGLQPTRLLCPGHSPGKNIGVGCHFLLQGIFPTQGLNHTSFSPALAGRFFTMRAIWEARKSDSASN